MKLITIVIIILLALMMTGCWEKSHEKAKVKDVDLTVTGGSKTPEDAIKEYCQAMGQRDFETASLRIWHDDWEEDPKALEFQRRTFVENMYKQGWKADDRDFNKFEIKSKSIKSEDRVEFSVSIGSRSGFYTEYPYTAVRHNGVWYVYLESITGTFGLAL